MFSVFCRLPAVSFSKVSCLLPKQRLDYKEVGVTWLLLKRSRFDLYVLQDLLLFSHNTGINLNILTATLVKSDLSSESCWDFSTFKVAVLFFSNHCWNISMFFISCWRNKNIWARGLRELITQIYNTGFRGGFLEPMLVELNPDQAGPVCPYAVLEWRAATCESTPYNVLSS